MGTTTRTADMVYDGTQISWQGRTFPASSGLSFADPDGKRVNYQNASFQCEADKGPVPEGLYRISLAVDTAPEAAVDKYGVMIPSDTIQYVPEGYKDTWGYNRVHLQLIELHSKCASSRGSFYLHDSQKGFTHGCIETIGFFFDLLRGSAMNAQKNKKAPHSLTLLVKYPAPDAPTYGETYVP